MQTSPDQIIGLNNITITNVPNAVPEPSTWAAMALGFGALASVILRRRAFRA